MKKKRQSRRILGQSACRRVCAGSEKSRGKSRERKVSEKRKNLIWLIMFAGVFLLALFVRAYRIGELPYGWHVDEAGMSYDMYSLLHYGTDRYYKFNPVYFINFGGGQNALYGYICGIFIKPG